MQVASKHFKERAHVKLHDERLQANHKKMQGKIISLDRGVAETGQFAIVVLNRGKRDGVEVGHVLAAYRTGELMAMEGPAYISKDTNAPSVPVAATVSSVAGTANVYVASVAAAPGTASEKSFSELKLPDERNGLVFVFRVFDRISYALVLQSRGTIHVSDVVQTP